MSKLIKNFEMSFIVFITLPFLFSLSFLFGMEERFIWWSRCVVLQDKIKSFIQLLSYLTLWALVLLKIFQLPQNINMLRRYRIEGSTMFTFLNNRHIFFTDIKYRICYVSYMALVKKLK